MVSFKIWLKIIIHKNFMETNYISYTVFALESHENDQK